MTKLEQLVSRCNGSVHVTANVHKSDYTTVRGYVKRLIERGFEPDDLEKEVLERCSEAGTIWELIAYPYTPVGQCRTFGVTLDEAVDAMLEGIPER